ncbi:uncharacterized protein [Venturia canescens]|nr:uncharacterized protein LOC122417321 isoform X2 [Venturia canescens]
MDVLNELEGNLGTTSMESTRGEEELMYVDKTIRNVVREREKIDDEKSSECSRVLRSKNSTQCVGLKNNSVDENKLPPSPLSLTESDSQMPIIRNKLGSGLSKPKNYVPLEVKKKVVALAQQHPEWPLKMLREHGSEYLGCFSQLWQWERHVARGGTLKDKYNTINHRTYEKFIEAQSSSKTVTVAMLRQWAIQVSREIHGAKLQFRATKGWVYNFRKLYDIQVTSQGHLTTNHKNTVAIPRKLMRRDRRSSAT